MINAVCIVADRLRSQKWPTEFVALPREGDLVASDEETLMVKKVIHRTRKVSRLFTQDDHPTMVDEPYIEVVLGK